MLRSVGALQPKSQRLDWPFGWGPSTGNFALDTHVGFLLLFPAGSRVREKILLE
jgi:hypothetical protein